MIHLIKTGHWPEWSDWIPIVGHYLAERELVDKKICRICRAEKYRYY